MQIAPSQNNSNRNSVYNGKKSIRSPDFHTVGEKTVFNAVTEVKFALQRHKGAMGVSNLQHRSPVSSSCCSLANLQPRDQTKNSNMTSLALSTLLYVRDKASEPKRTMNMSTAVGTTGARDPFERKLMRTLDEVLQSKQAGPLVPNELMVKEKKNTFWRQFVISKAPMVTGHR